MGRGIVQGKASKQNLNTKISTETELVGASDYIPWTVWAKWFLGEQGYTLERNIFYQDNMSAMGMESNSRKSCGEKSRHISIRYFFIKDVLKRENIELVHCPTERMIADFYTKPLQGSLFRKLRDILMGLAPFPEEERVAVCKTVSLETDSSGNGSEPVSREPNKPVSKEPSTINRNVKSVTYADVVRGENGG